MTDARSSSRLLAFRAAGVADALHVSGFVLRAVLRSRERGPSLLARRARDDATVAAVGLALAGIAERLLRRDLDARRVPRPAVRRLLVTGLLVNTVGTTLLLTAPGPAAGRARRSRTGRAATGYLLVGGDLVSVAYLLAARR